MDKAKLNFDSLEFNQAYNFAGELGAFWQPQMTTFRVWAPTAS